MFLFSDFVTPLEDRIPIPGWFLPGFLVVGMLSTLPPPEYRYLRIALSGLVLFAMLLRAPKYTSGNVNPDFVSGLFTSGLALKWWEFVVYRHSEQEFWRVPSWLERTPPKAKDIPHEGNGHAVEGNGHAIEGNGHTIVGNGHAIVGNGHAIVVNGHAIERNGQATKGNGKLENLKHEELKRTNVATHGEYETWQDKLRWSVGLWSTTRGVEWNWGIKNLQRTSPNHLTRLRFVRHSFYRLLFCILAIDFVRAIVAWTDYGDPTKVPSLNLLKEPTFPRLVISWMGGLEVYNGLQIPYYAFATATVALGICRPEQWPPIFGSFRDNAWSVRTFWGKTWHAQIRRSITTPATAVADALRLQRGTLLRRYSELCLAFFFSALCHVWAAYLICRGTGGMFTHWLSQAAVIMAEDYVIHLGKEYGIKDTIPVRVIGHIWVIIWMSLYPTLPTGTAVSLHAGSGHDQPDGLTPSAWFPPPAGCNTLLKVMLDRGVVFFFLSRVLEVVVAQTPADLLRVGEGALGAGALWLCRR